MVIATYMLPPVALAVPLYMGLSYLGLLNNVFGLALVYLTILAPFTTWLMKSGFDSIPREIESAAMIDGARPRPDAAASSRCRWPHRSWRRQRSLPSCLPGTNSSMRCCSPPTSAPKRSTVAIADLAGGRVSDYGLIATAGVLAALPPVLIGLVMQRALISRAHQRRRQGMNMTSKRQTRPAGLAAIEREMARQNADAIASFEAAGETGREPSPHRCSKTGRLLLLGMGGSHAVNRAVEPLYRSARHRCRSPCRSPSSSASRCRSTAGPSS